ncbi:hypothetical protein CEP52_013962 [Fusarium oligoseptatum]|uniref:Uncharacterized protein n=2 Tax=Fusarium solani species complex TaxID=232080 RepID=A0A428SQW9_9HYPO|nr:hypothetical protein CEP52_013962 [Fusarium oligoseptatum]
MPTQPTIRLQFWHDRSFAPAPGNDDLLDFMQAFNIEPWKVHSPQVLTGRCWGDGLVPVEVDFKYRPTSRCNFAEAAVQLCRFFADVVKRYADELFHTSAHIANMYPVGETLTEDVVAMFLRVVLLRPLTMQSHGYIKSNPSLNHNVIFDTLSLMVEIPCQVLEVEKMRNAGNWTALKDTILSKLSSSQGSAVPEGVVEDWNRSLAAFEDVQRFSKHIKPCFDDLSGQKYVSGGTFYTNLAQIRVAISQFSVYQKCSQSIIEKLVKSYEKKAEDSRPAKVCSMAILLGCTYMYAPIDPMTALALSGAIIGGVIKISEFFGGMKNINEFQDKIANFEIALRNAQFALGILFCNQALGMPFPLLAKPKGVETLEGLGIDVKHVKGEEYSHKFALKSLKEFRRSYEDLEKVRDLVRKDAGIKEFLETTMASASPDGGEPMDCQED